MAKIPCMVRLSAHPALKTSWGGIITPLKSGGLPPPVIIAPIKRAADLAPLADAFAEAVHLMWPEASFRVCVAHDNSNGGRKVPGFDAAKSDFLARVAYRYVTKNEIRTSKRDNMAALTCAPLAITAPDAPAAVISAAAAIVENRNAILAERNAS